MAGVSGRLLLPSCTSSSTNSSTRLEATRAAHIKKRNTTHDATFVLKAYNLAPGSATATASGVVFSPEKMKVGIKKAVGEGVLALPGVIPELIAKTIEILRKRTRDRKKLASQIQMFIEQGILNCRFFTLAAVAGTLFGSIICFVEGCFLVLQSFLEYFRTNMFHTLGMGGGDSMHLLIEAIDMFLVGTGMLNFGFGIYALFVSSRLLMNGSTSIPNGRLHKMIAPALTGRQWMSQAKSKLGRAVVMILQAGTVERFKDVEVVTGLDLVCFAAAIFISSASLFLLSRLLQNQTNLEHKQIY